MKEAWCLASTEPIPKPSEVVNPYGRCFTIEERCDTSNRRFEWMSGSDGVSQRRDRLLLIIVLAQTLLHILGQARRWECRDSKPTPSNPAFTSPYRQAKPICNFSQPCPIQLLRRFLELLLQHAKTSKLPAPTVQPMSHENSGSSARNRMKGLQPDHQRSTVHSVDGPVSASKNAGRRVIGHQFERCSLSRGCPAPGEARKRDAGTPLRLIRADRQAETFELERRPISGARRQEQDFRHFDIVGAAYQTGVWQSFTFRLERTTAAGTSATAWAWFVPTEGQSNMLPAEGVEVDQTCG